jgi:hypothetical protein
MHKRKRTTDSGQEMEVQDLDWFIARQELEAESKQDAGSAPAPRPPTADAVWCFVFTNPNRELHDRFCALFPERSEEETRPLTGVTERSVTIFGESAVVHHIDVTDGGLDLDTFAVHLYSKFVVGPICVDGDPVAITSCVEEVGRRLGLEQLPVHKANRCNEMFEAMRQTKSPPDFDLLREFCHAIGMCEHLGPPPSLYRSPAFLQPRSGATSFEVLFTPFQAEEMTRRLESRRERSTNRRYRRRRQRKRKEPTEKELEEFILLRQAQLTHEKESAVEPPEAISAENMACKICMTNKINTVFAPCGHACACTKCCIGLETKGQNTDEDGMVKCPMCRKAVVLYLPFHI